MQSAVPSFVVLTSMKVETTKSCATLNNYVVLLLRSAVGKLTFDLQSKIFVNLLRQCRGLLGKEGGGTRSVIYLRFAIVVFTMVSTQTLQEYECIMVPRKIWESSVSRNVSQL